jgi:cysteinyl-tRNA synthetase
LNSHYRSGLDFTWESLDASQTALKNMRSLVSGLKNQEERTTLTRDKEEKRQKYNQQFTDALSNDLNVSQALAICWEMLKSNVPSRDKYELVRNFDEVLGLNMDQEPAQKEIPEEIKKLAEEREKLRKEEKFEETDRIRKEIREKGFEILDTDNGPVIKPADGKNI